MKKFLSLFTALIALALTAGSGEAAIKIGVTGTMYEELWAPAKERLAKEGIEIEIVQFSEYTLPNNALSNGEIDLNAFQHSIYLETEKKEYGYKLENIGYTFVIPLNLYSVKKSSVSELKDEDIVAIPNDLPNQGRGLKVLESAGLIQLRKGAGFSPAIDDIEKYNVAIKLVELKGNTIPSALQDVDAAIINGNYSIDFGIDPKDAIYHDDVLPREYWCMVTARSEDLTDPDKVALYKKIVKSFQTEATKDVFNNKFGGYFVAAGWDEDFLR